MEKKLLPLHILRLLAEHTDSEHKITCLEIVNMLAAKGIECERKSVRSNIDALIADGYEIVSGRNGTYLASRIFEPGELRFLIDGILANRYICAPHAEDLVERLAKLGGRHFREALHATANADEWQRTTSAEFLLTADVIHTAIHRCRKLCFRYNIFDAKKQLRPRTSIPYTVSPYRMLMHNGRYYLLANKDGTDGVRHFRLDYITDATVTDDFAVSLGGAESGIDLAAHDSRQPYLYGSGDDATSVELLVDRDSISEIIDWFGREFDCFAYGERYVVRLLASPAALRYWLLQYGLHVRVLSPQSLVDSVARDVETIYRKYHGDDHANS